MSLESTSDTKQTLSIVVIGGSSRQSRAYIESTLGHVDAGKSTLMGRLLYELGKTYEKRGDGMSSRASEIHGRSNPFRWAWEMDASAEERARYLNLLSLSRQFDRL